MWTINFNFNKKCSRWGIELAGISSDGDPRLLSAMVHESSLPNGIRVTQDIIHICTKARNRLLKPNINLPMGKMKVTVDHLRQLLKIDKTIHGLFYSDVYPTDRMNYSSFEKIVADRVVNTLRERIPNSEATVQYLLLFRDIKNSFLLHDLEPLKRIFLMFRSLYFLRYWRQYIQSSPFYNVKENFITYNLYTCVEINANSLIQLIKMFRDRNAPEMFLPCIFDSQTCERIFRLFRSMTTTQYTKINFSILELIHKIGRIEVQNNIAYCKLDVDGINIPQKRIGKTKMYALPSDEQISDIMQKSKEDALQRAQFFGLTDRLTNVNQIEYKFVSKLASKETYQVNYDEELDDGDEEDVNNHASDNNHDQDDIDENDEIFNESSCESHIDIHVNSDSNSDTALDENSPLTYVSDENGEKKKILKSTLVWSLTEKNVRMSNDRTRRFQCNPRKRKAS